MSASKMILNLPRHQWTALKVLGVLIFAINIYLLLRVMSDEKIIQYRSTIDNHGIQRYIQENTIAKAKKQVHPIAHLLPSENSPADTKKCNLPKLSLQHDSLSFAFHSMEPMNCSGMNLFFLKDNFLILNKTALGDKKLENCEIFGIKREGDSNYNLVSLMTISGKEKVFVSCDFLYIKCNFENKDEGKDKREVSDNENNNIQDSNMSDFVKKSNSSADRSSYDAYNGSSNNSHGLKLSKRNQAIGDTLYKTDLNSLAEQAISNENFKNSSKNFKISRKDDSPFSNTTFIGKFHHSVISNNRSVSLSPKLKSAEKEINRENTTKGSSNMFQYRNELSRGNKRPNSRSLLQVDLLEENENLSFHEENPDVYKNHLAELGELEYNENLETKEGGIDQDLENEYMEPWNYQELNWEEREEPCDSEQFLVQISPHKDVLERATKTVKQSKGRDLNILMLGIDSMSRMTFERKLPQTLNFLKKELHATLFEGYNIVGDGTTQALLPIFTGKLQQEIPDILDIYLDDLDFIWKRYQEQGYATVFAEDEPNLGVFNLRLKGFDMQPTDHYMRYFWQARGDSHLKESCSEDFCTGAIPNHLYLLQYMEDFFYKYQNISHFAVGFSGELSHDENNPSEYLDLDLKDFLHSLQKKGYLKNTVLFVFADHGCRKGSFRRTLQGKLEERLPFFSMVLPKWFKKKHKSLYKNVVKNSKGLTSPFDVHETLMDLLDISKIDTKQIQSGKRGISLLRPIPADRTCADAGIDTHWCTCVQQNPVPSTDSVVKGAVNAVISTINNLTQVDRHLCAPLKLNSTHSASLVVPNQQLLKFHRTEETGNFGVTYGNHTLDVAEFQVTVETDKCHGIFEATVQVKFYQGEDGEERKDSGSLESSYTVLEQDISRIDTYGTQSACICHKRPQIMKFCCCNEFLQGKKLKSC